VFHLSVFVSVSRRVRSCNKKTFPRWEKGFIFQSIIHATFLPLSPKDDEQQGNDVNIRMIQGVHSRFSVFVCFQRQCIRVQGKSACYAGCFLSDYGKDMDIKSVEQIIS